MISQQPIRPNKVESCLKVALAEKHDKPPLVGRTWKIQKDEAVNSFSSPDPPFELPSAPNLDKVPRAGPEKGFRHNAELHTARFQGPSEVCQ